MKNILCKKGRKRDKVWTKNSDIYCLTKHGDLNFIGSFCTRLWVKRLYIQVLTYDWHQLGRKLKEAGRWPRFLPDKWIGIPNHHGSILCELHCDQYQFHLLLQKSWLYLSKDFSDFYTWRVLELRDSPDITLDPLYHVTLGIGFPPPDSQTSLNSWPSLKGPIMELDEMSRPSVVDTVKFFGSAAKKRDRRDLNLAISSEMVLEG